MFSLYTLQEVDDDYDFYDCDIDLCLMIVTTENSYLVKISWHLIKADHKVVRIEYGCSTKLILHLV